MSNSTATPRIAVIGCGAIAETFHLPALTSLLSDPKSLVLVDTNRERLQAMADRFRVEQIWDAPEAVEGPLDGVLIATPPSTHYPLAAHFLSRRIPVLCEKPLAESLAEAQALVQLAAESGTSLAVNQTRRLFPAFQQIHRWIRASEFGTLQSIEYHDGYAFDWPAASAFHFAPQARGVVSDTGIHLLDTICWWLGGSPNLCAAYSDAHGGPEAMAELELEFQGCAIRLKVSRLGPLRNGIRIEGTQARVDLGIDEWSQARLQYHHARRPRESWTNPPNHYASLARPLMENFVQVCRRAAGPLISGESTLPAIALLEEFYRRAEPFPRPWDAHWEALHVA